MDPLMKLARVLQEHTEPYSSYPAAEAVLAAGYCERNAVLEEAAQAAMVDTMGPVGNPCCMHTRDNVEQAIVDAIRALKKPTP